MQLPPFPVSIERRIDFSQTDAAGLIHFTTYFTLMEAAEAELFRLLGLSLIWREGNEFFGFPRVDCQCKFRKPLHFDSKVTVQLSITDLEPRRIHYSFLFMDESGQKCGSGTMTTACAIRRTDDSIEGAHIPETYSEALLKWKNQES